MKNLPAPAILATFTSQSGRERLIKYPFNIDGENFSITESLELLMNKNPQVDFRQLTLGEYFEYLIQNDLFTPPFTFSSEEEKFNYWLRSLLLYNFSDVDEQTYKKWYENLNNGIETIYM